jgi:hypothetical protein
MSFIPPKLCAICQTPFTPQKRARGYWTETCGAQSCRVKLAVRRSDWGTRVGAAVAAKRAKAQLRIAGIAAARFGELSEREQAIFAFGESEGYSRGYNARMSGEQRRGNAA